MALVSTHAARQAAYGALMLVLLLALQLMKNFSITTSMNMNPALIQGIVLSSRS